MRGRGSSYAHGFVDNRSNLLIGKDKCFGSSYAFEKQSCQHHMHRLVHRRTGVRMRPASSYVSMRGYFAGVAMR